MRLNNKEIITSIANIKAELKNDFSVKSIGIFGSFARGNETPESDVDVLVELEDPTFDKYMDLKFRLEELLGHSVDLVILDTVKPRIKPVIEREVIYV